MTKVKGMQCSSYSRVAVEESGKMSVIWLSESAEVFNARIRVQLYLCCCWDGASFMSTNTTTASPPPYSLCITLHHSISLSLCLSLLLLWRLLPLTHTYFSFSWPITSVLNYTSFSLGFSLSLQSSVFLCSFTSPALTPHLFCLFLLVSSSSHPSMHSRFTTAYMMVLNLLI